MSAFVVNEDHVKQLALAWNWGRYNNHTPKEITETARELMRENIRSVAHRYNEPIDSRELAGPVPTPEAELIEVGFREYCNLEPVAILCMCDCLEYQSCETENYYDSPAFDLLKQIRRTAIHRLPGYDDAPWEYRKPSADEIDEIDEIKANIINQLSGNS